MAVNDINKEKLVNKGLAELYGDILCGDFNTDEKLHAAEGLWTLSFNTTCRQTIENTESCMRGDY